MRKAANNSILSTRELALRTDLLYLVSHAFNFVVVASPTVASFSQRGRMELIFTLPLAISLLRTPYCTRCRSAGRSVGRSAGPACCIQYLASCIWHYSSPALLQISYLLTVPTSLVRASIPPPASSHFLPCQSSQPPGHRASRPIKGLGPGGTAERREEGEVALCNCYLQLLLPLSSRIDLTLDAHPLLSIDLNSSSDVPAA